jgi:hypothetical protein
MKAVILAVFLVLGLTCSTSAGEPGKESIFGECFELWETGAFDEAIDLWNYMRLEDAINDYKDALDEYEKWLDELFFELYGDEPYS